MRIIHINSGLWPINFSGLSLCAFIISSLSLGLSVVMVPFLQLKFIKITISEGICLIGHSLNCGG
jgi:hypothetical protein